MSGAVAWADAVQAAAFFAADPVGLGGIAVRAGAGPVRDRFMIVLNEFLPPGTPIRHVPLHTLDDRLLGGIDLAATLRAGRPIARVGLLAEADGGVLVLAMAERIDAGTAARLQAVIDAGAVMLQRDGLSRILAARFGIVALDEGAEPDERLPGPLLDRMAFHVDLTEVSLSDVRNWDAGSLLVPDPTQAATDDDTPNDDTHHDAIASFCHAALALGIESLRAPLFALRAARIAAAGERISDAALGLAARLVLVPRATRFPAPDDPGSPPEAEPPAQADDDPSSGEHTEPDRPLEDVVLDAAKAALPADLLARLGMIDGGRGLARVSGRAGQFKASVKRGRPIGTRQGELKGGARLHLLETLKAAAPWQMLRRRPGATERFEVRRDDFRIVRFRQRVGTTTVFAVDASGSAAMARLGEAKGAVELLLADCYIRRDQVALLAFRGQGATLLMPPTGSLLRAKRCLSGLPGGGPTPLAAGIEAALRLCETIRRAGRTPVITLLTDARANIARDGTAGRPRAEAQATEVARSVAAAGVACLLVDTSPRPNPFARILAEAMRAQYVPLPYADAAALSRAVRSASAA
jgi:magnesium chelatase subunit D